MKLEQMRITVNFGNDAMQYDTDAIKPISHPFFRDTKR